MLIKYKDPNLNENCDANWTLDLVYGFWDFFYGLRMTQTVFDNVLLEHGGLS